MVKLIVSIADPHVANVSYLQNPAFGPSHMKAIFSIFSEKAFQVSLHLHIACGSTDF